MRSTSRINPSSPIAMSITLVDDESQGLPATIYRYGRDIGQIRLRFWDWPLPKPHNFRQIDKIFDLLLELGDLVERRRREEEKEAVLYEGDASEVSPPDLDWVCQE
jgi:hypothetical protein